MNISNQNVNTARVNNTANNVTYVQVQSSEVENLFEENEQNQSLDETLSFYEDAYSTMTDYLKDYTTNVAIAMSNKIFSYFDKLTNFNKQTQDVEVAENIEIEQDAEEENYLLNDNYYKTIIEPEELDSLAEEIQEGGNGNQWGYPDKCLSFAYAYGAWIDGTSESEMNGDSSSDYLDASQYSEFSGTKEEVLANVKSQLDEGKPVVLQVNGNSAGTSRHYVTVVGYSSSAGDTLTEDDLIILDTYDGQIEGMGNNGARFMISGQDTGRDYDYQIYIKD